MDVRAARHLTAGFESRGQRTADRQDARPYDEPEILNNTGPRPNSGGVFDLRIQEGGLDPLIDSIVNIRPSRAA
jgi:hypothetical protein